MYISNVRIHNYKSFNQSSLLELRQGFNIIVGKNNAGKTALLEALSLQFTQKPHRSSKTVPKANSSINPTSSMDIAFTVDHVELIGILQGFNSPFQFPFPSNISISGNVVGAHNRSEIMEYVNQVLSQSTITFRLQVLNGGSPLLTNFPSYEAKARPVHGSPGNRLFAQCRFKDGQVEVGENTIPGAETNEIGCQLFWTLRAQTYCFRAERMHIARCGVGTIAELKPNAENLAEVLGNLQGNVSRFRRFNDFVRKVLPDVTQVTVRNLGGNIVEVLVWYEDPDQERIDLAVPLDECGTGVSQVLAILYVIVNSVTPQTFIIDEPQSFLHPGAVRKLIDILKLKEHAQHQYIIATHSPAVITATEPATITLVKREAGESVLAPIDLKETQRLRTCLAEVGARLSDVFGADDILWVEGQTEEICFPKIVEKILNRTLLGTVIRGLRNTGDLEPKHAIAVFEIYDRLSHSDSLLPPSLGFMLDDEGRSEQQKTELRHRSGNRLYFTPRKMFENYLLHPKAISILINKIDTERPQPVTEEIVHEWLESKAKDDKYCAPRRPGAEWRSYVHGAKVLHDLFSELTENRLDYDGNKVAYGIALTEWIIEHEPDHLHEIAEHIEEVLDRKKEYDAV
jgi:predicted ATPase